MRDQLKDVVSSFKSASKEPKATGAKTRSYTSAKLAALNALREDLVAIARSAEVISAGNPGFKNTFILPDRRRKNELAQAARQFIKDAEPLKAEFQALEMKENFLEQLQTRLDAYEAAQSGQSSPATERPGATDALSGLVADGSKILNVLDVVVRNKYSEQADVLAAWEEASALEFTPRRKKGSRGTPPAAADAKK
ncbi:MAG TPA: hypothetical protein VF627_07850 [Abditibacterium sp.]